MTTGLRGNAQKGQGVPVRRGNGSAPARHHVLALALLTALFALTLAQSTARATPATTLGVYAGSGNLSAISQFESRLGQRVVRGHDYLDKRSWSTMLDVSWLSQQWSRAGFAEPVVLTAPMLPDTGGTLAEGAAGDFNVHFRALAEKLVAAGHGSAVLRLGPEFNGNWFRWTIDVPDGGRLFAAYWRQIVTTMRAVRGAKFKFDWCPNAGSSWIGAGQQLEAADAWPGDDVVDYVGIDIYDQSWAPHRADPVARWSEYVNQKNGLAWHARFAAAHGKPLTFPEWGLVHRYDGMGGGDTPFFVEQMYRWIALHPIAYHLYFDSRDPNAEYELFGGRFPKAAARFVKLFGSNPPAGLPPPAPQPPAPAPPPPPPAPGDGLAAGAWPSGGSGSRAASSTDPRRGVHGAGREAARGPFTGSDPAKLSIARARIMRSEAKLDILAPITRRASGAATVVLHAAGERSRFTAGVDSARGQMLIRERISPAQARAGTGILTVRYPGDSDTQPQEVRLRAASQKANLALARPRLQGGRLRVAGTISRRARGLVRTQIMYVVRGANVMREYSAPVRDGRWKLDVALAPAIAKEIVARQGTVQSSTLFTGYLPARMRGEMRSHQVLGR